MRDKGKVKKNALISFQIPHSLHLTTPVLANQKHDIQRAHYLTTQLQTVKQIDKKWKK